MLSAAAVVGAAAIAAADAGPAAAAAEEEYEDQNDPEAGITAVAVSTKHFLDSFLRADESFRVSGTARVFPRNGERFCCTGEASVYPSGILYAARRSWLPRGVKLADSTHGG